MDAQLLTFTVCGSEATLFKVDDGTVKLASIGLMR